MKKIIIVGSMNMDMVMNLEYMPKPGETMHAEGFFTNPGGKGANQAVAAKKQGCDVFMIGSVGQDGYGTALIDNLNKYDVDTSFVYQKYGVNTGLANILITDGDNRIILDAGANYMVTQDDVKKGLDELSSPKDIVILQLEVPMNIVEYTIKYAKEKDLLVIFNPAPAKKICNELLSLVDILILNETETEILLGIDKLTDLQDALNKFKSMGVKNSIITLGENGSVFLKGDNLYHQKAIVADVVDTTAAGDTFIGAFASRMIQGDSIKSCVEYASYASSLSVSKKGAISSIPTSKSVLELIEKGINK